MNHLETYFQGEYKADASELDELDRLINKVYPTFIECFSDRDKQWPYSIKSNQIKFEKPSKYSSSTNSMILMMMKLANESVDRDYLFPKITSESIFKVIDVNKITIEKWKNIIDTALIEYKKQILSNMSFYITHSDTYGYDDPMSLSWCHELLKDDPEILKKINESAKETSNRINNNSSFKNILKFLKKEIISKQIYVHNADNKKYKLPTDNFIIKSPDLNEHSFILLKYSNLIQKIKFDTSDKDKIYDFFENKIHLHLSYSDIPDSRFDPSELVFSLEGAIRSKSENAVNFETIERSFAVLEAAQAFTPYWRPINPIYATPQGQILLPLSVEVANSLLRICSLLDVDRSDIENTFSKHAKMFKRYFRWLKAQLREVKSPITKSTCWGWASEHIGGDDEIHLFQTSEILCFLINYRHMLQDRIARRSLVSSGLKVDYSYMSKQPHKKSISAYWKNIEIKFEPLLELPKDSEFRVYSQIRKKFIEPRDSAKGGDPKYSILLYGPPGTGKSIVGENIADTLRCKFITVTPSDFLAGGSAEVETRAKFIFKCLEEQKNSVILFDEIDQFLLDRDSTEYKSQTGIFQFMTPGMLPKINDLRKKSRSIFIIATNYIDRIDAAIKRPGRIDLLVPLMPPSNLQRIKILNRCTPKSHLKNLEETKLCTYTELTNSVERSNECKLYVSRFLKDETKVNFENNNAKETSKTPAIEYILMEIIEHQKSTNFKYGKGFELQKPYCKNKNLVKHICPDLKSRFEHVFTDIESFQRLCD